MLPGYKKLSCAHLVPGSLADRIQGWKIMNWKFKLRRRLQILEPVIKSFERKVARLYLNEFNKKLFCVN